MDLHCCDAGRDTVMTIWIPVLVMQGNCCVKIDLEDAMIFK